MLEMVVDAGGEPADPALDPDPDLGLKPPLEGADDHPLATHPSIPAREGGSQHNDAIQAVPHEL